MHTLHDLVHHTTKVNLLDTVAFHPTVKLRAPNQNLSPDLHSRKRVNG
jgi:hypothetical protein